VVGLLPSLSAALLAEPPRPAEIAWADSDDEYLRMSLPARPRSCRRCLPACLTTEARVAVTPDPFETYLALRQPIRENHHGAFFRAEGMSRS
jgi:hypothetical protein